MQPEVFGAVRSLLKAAKIAFKSDTRMILAAKAQLRKEIDKNRTVTNPEQIQVCLVNARDAADFLMTGLVQAEVDAAGTKAKMSPQARHSTPVSQEQQQH